MHPHIPFMIAVDGPAGAGKGTLAKHLAEVYDFAYLDTGLLYRAIAYEMLQNGYDLADVQLAEKIAGSLDPATFKESALRDEAVGGAASFISAYPGVRAALLKFQRHFAQHPPFFKKGAVLDGRDIGTVILPEAQAKIFVTADLEIRAKRRFKEMHERGIESRYEAIFEEMQSRDLRDEVRKISQLKPAEDALIIDTSHLNIEEVFLCAQDFVSEKLKTSL
ncbi:Cytidylate kinase [Candidatus Bealeia paramacronuclearis]|uniref:Cytidylate kinase n=1 Tax=Candidatus Bealeia paramacronuclearis TaxID=1921001 RepID=A0ABZ2C5Q9_9PROT|nr:Cytidylate kinase [Candidatus Bealeia paramacronuclearis]